MRKETARPQERSDVLVGEEFLTRKGKDLFLLLACVALTVTLIVNLGSGMSMPAFAIGSPSQSIFDRRSFGGYIRPLEGGWPTQGVGWNSRGEYHRGVDIATENGTPILAAATGQVTRSGWWGGYGICVVISHSNGEGTLYGHLSETKVSVGDQVSQGDLIGLSGNTGTVRGPGGGYHLHYEVLRGTNNLQQEYVEHALRHPNMQ